MRIEDLEGAPNPQFVRPDWQDLSGQWTFQFDDDNVGIRERWFADPSRLDRTITVPYPPESELSGINDKSFHTIAWYARELTDDRQNEHDRLTVTFGAVDFEATVWVDGIQVGQHTGGHTPFTMDVTDALEPDRPTHSLVVRSVDDPHDVEQPRGKQDWLSEPHGIWYYRTSGIWQPVWSAVTPAVRIDDIRWQYDPGDRQIRFDVTLSQAPVLGSTLTLAIAHEGEIFTQSMVTAASRVVSGSLGLGTVSGNSQGNQLRWNPENPQLLPTRVTLSAPGARDDVVLGYVGLRTIEIRGRNFLINGRPRFLKFVLNQGYWPESQMTAPSPEALKREVELILELGFNGARIHQKIEDPRFLFWADRLGLLLWGECANAFHHSELAIGRRADEWREAVIRDRNHPSVIAWVPFNESWGINEVGSSQVQQEAVLEACALTNRLDGTRPVVGNDGWENAGGDLCTIHDYSWDPEVLAQRYATEEGLAQTIETFRPGSRRVAVGGFDPSDKPVLITEYGGVSFAPGQGENWFGYGKVANHKEFEAKYREITEALHASDVICGVCYTQLADTEQEINGLLTADRKPKLPMEILREITSGSRS